MNHHVPALLLAADSPSTVDKAPRILRAAEMILPGLAAGRAIGAAALRSAMIEALGGSDAEGAWLWKDAYEACEVAQVLFLRRYGPAMRRQARTPARLLAMLSRVAGLLPTQTRRSDESQAYQQFSTPIGLGFVAANRGWNRRRRRRA
jgi:protein strawberry notch